MALKTINDLTATTSIANDDVLEIWRTLNGDTRKITKSDFLDGLDTEVINARTAIPYLAGSPFANLSAELAALSRNMKHVEAYGAVGDGVTDDRVAIQAALDAAAEGDTIAFAAGKTYLVPTTLEIKDANITLLGYGATLDASDLDNDTDTTTVNPSITAANKDNITILGLRLIGPDITGSLDINAPENRQTTGIYFTADGVTGNRCMIRDCRIEGFFRGGIYVQGNYHSIIGNHLNRVRYRPPEMGSIFLNGNENTTVVGNVITGVWGSGIAANNSYRCTIQGNIIEGIDWTVEAQAQSMGIVTYNCSYFSIVGNTIERVTDEGIVMSSGGGTTVTMSNYNTITGNVIVNPKLYGICLRAVSGSATGSHYTNYNTISGNVIVANAQMPGGVADVLGLYIDSSTIGNGFNFAEGNKFEGNMVISDGHPIDRGFVMTGAQITRTSVVNNVFKGCDIGIALLATHSLVANNAVYDSVFHGINVPASCNYCLVTGNKITGSVASSITMAGALTGTKVVRNFIDKPVDTAGVTGSAWWHGDNHREDMVSSGTATLSGGTVNISGFTAALCFGSLRLTRLAPASTPSNTGALFISNIDLVSLNRVTVSSTNALDDGTFLWELVK